MQLYNTLSRTKEPFEKPTRRALRMFVCGPTVHDDSHVGHARTYLTFDTFVRYLRAQQWRVTYLQNITDVDDKIIDRARRENVRPKSIATRYARSYRTTMRLLGIQSATYAYASAHIAGIVRQVKTLVQKKYAYTIAGDGIYFDVKKFSDYGKLSGRTVAQAEDSVSRIDESIAKRSRADFVLWKFPKVEPKKTTALFTHTPDGEPVWKTSLGWGRPGWHIEDTAITEQYFGPQYDLHGGGIDLLFPHHEAEVTQQESASGKKPFVRFWMHTGLVTIAGEKMSKSKGNFVTITDALKHVSPVIFRWMVLSYHYRSPIDFATERLFEAARSFHTVKTFMDALAFVATVGGHTRREAMLPTALATLEKNFSTALDDDFGTPTALAAFFTCMSSVQPRLWVLSRGEAKRVLTKMRELFATLGVTIPKTTIPARIAALVAKRELYRSHKQFAHADALRKEMIGLGYEVDDTPLGPFIHEPETHAASHTPTQNPATRS